MKENLQKKREVFHILGREISFRRPLSLDVGKENFGKEEAGKIIGRNFLAQKPLDIGLDYKKTAKYGTVFS